MPSASSLDPRLVAGNWLSLGLAVGASLPWTAVALSGAGLPPLLVALLAGGSILGAAFLLSWAVETAELDVPPALAVSVLALVAVLPEYAVDATFAWNAGRDPSQAHYAIANMTGGNRLLLGLGWSLMVFLAWGRFGKAGIRLPAVARLDVGVLFVASLYALVPVVRGRLTLLDTAVFVLLYLAYVVAAARAEREEDGEEALVGPSALLGVFGPAVRRPLLLAILAWAAGAIYLAAEPFAHALVQTGLEYGVDEFLLVQWVAPLASEAPELAVAGLLVGRGRFSKGLLTLVSSKVNQWTLLVGTLPVVSSLSAGRPAVLPFDGRQQEEVLLTAAQSLFGVAVLGDLHLSRLQAVLLAALFLAQFAVPGTHGRLIFAFAYLAAAAFTALALAGHRRGLGRALRAVALALRGARP